MADGSLLFKIVKKMFRVDYARVVRCACFAVRTQLWAKGARLTGHEMAPAILSIGIVTGSPAKRD